MFVILGLKWSIRKHYSHTKCSSTAKEGSRISALKWTFRWKASRRHEATIWGVSSVDYTPEDLSVTNFSHPSSFTGESSPVEMTSLFLLGPVRPSVTLLIKGCWLSNSGGKVVGWSEGPWVCVCVRLCLTTWFFVLLLWLMILFRFIPLILDSFFFSGSFWHTFDSLPGCYDLCKVLFGAFALFQITLRTPASSRNNIHNSCVFELVKNCFLLRKEMRLASCWRTSDDGQDQTVILGSAGQSLKWKCSCCLGELRYCF